METLNKFIAVAKKKNYDSVDDAELKEFIENIKNNKDAITYIGLAGNSYSKEFCEQFGALIKECPKLTVSISYNLIISTILGPWFSQ